MARSCIVCGGSMAHRAGQARVCSDACARERKRQYDAEHPRTPCVPEPVVFTKWCPRCERRLPAEAFGRNRAAPSGLQSFCRACRSAYEARPERRAVQRLTGREWARRHAEEIRRRYWTEPGRRERHKAESRERYRRNAEADNAAVKARYRAKRELIERFGERRECAHCGRRFWAIRKPGDWGSAYSTERCREAHTMRIATILCAAISSCRSSSDDSRAARHGADLLDQVGAPKGDGRS